jgi:hypothetical protein
MMKANLGSDKSTNHHEGHAKRVHMHVPYTMRWSTDRCMASRTNPVF